MAPLAVFGSTSHMLPSYAGAPQQPNTVLGLRRSKGNETRIYDFKCLYSAVHWKATGGANRKGHGSLAGRRIVGVMRTIAQGQRGEEWCYSPRLSETLKSLNLKQGEADNTPPLPSRETPAFPLVTKDGKRTAVLIQLTNSLQCDHKSTIWTHGTRAKCLRS